MHLDFEQPEYIFASNFTYEVFFERFEFRVDKCNYSVDVFRHFELSFLVYAFFDEDSFEGVEEELFQKFGSMNLQFFAEKVLGVVNRMSEYVAHRKEDGFVVGNDATVGRYADFAIGEGV